MFKKIKTFVAIMAVGGLPLLPFAQIESCTRAVPPFQVNGIMVTHSMNENAFITDEFGAVFCPPYTNIINPETSICLGCINLSNPQMFNPFTYHIYFSKPIISFDFLLTTGNDWENFIFQSICSNFSFVDNYSCSIQIIGDTIFSGITPVPGNGYITLNFDLPIQSVSIFGDGGGAGSGFWLCSNSITPAPFYAAFSAPQQACPQDSVSFSAYIGGQEPYPAPYIFSYTVNGGAVQTASTTGTSESVQVALPQTPGAYTYELLSVTDANGNSVNINCNNIQTVTVQPPPVAHFTASPSSGMAPLQVSLTNQSTNATQYQWLLNNTPITPQNNTITLQDTGTYQITLIATNALGCTDTAVQTVHVLEQLQVTIPNVFTPNNDDVNDWFGFTANVEAEAGLVILNRWGNVVFEKSFVTTPNVFQELWDGASIGSAPTPSSVPTPNSGPAPDGVYFYKLILKSEDWEEEFVGFVTLKR